MAVLNPADYTPTAVAPVARNPGNFTPTGAGPASVALNYAPTGAAPASRVLNTSNPALPTMPAIWKPAFRELTAGASALATLNVTAGDVDKVIEGLVTVNDGEEPVRVSYRVKHATDAQALPGIVRPANFNADTNPYLFVQC